ncbi:MAG: hypothetical protein MUO52_18275 [Desulfobacterales bacterium]|nr:hypothetical protein [Desulfobacterales bacterium]
MIKKIPFFEDPFSPGIKVLHTVGHKSQVIVVKEVGKTDKRPEEPQHKKVIRGTFFRIKVLEKAVEEKAFQVVPDALNPGIKHRSAPKEIREHIPGFE